MRNEGEQIGRGQSTNGNTASQQPRCSRSLVLAASIMANRAPSEVALMGSESRRPTPSLASGIVFSAYSSSAENWG